MKEPDQDFKASAPRLPKSWANCGEAHGFPDPPGCLCDCDHLPSTSPTVPATPACAPHITHSPEAFTPPSGPPQHTRAQAHVHTSTRTCTQAHAHTRAHWLWWHVPSSQDASPRLELWSLSGPERSRAEQVEGSTDSLLGGREGGGDSRKGTWGRGALRRPRLPDSCLSVTL